MMKANELRIGNFAFVRLDTPPMPIATVNLTDFILLDKGKDHLLPIPLTPEWLERFGYNEISDEFYVGRFGNEYEKHRIFSQTGKAYEGFNVHFVKSNYGGIEESDIVARWDGDSLRSIQYVHQLQNLYFALTGEELTVTPPVHTHDGK